VDDVSVALEHVDLLNGLDGLYVKLLQRGLELLVVGTGALVDLLDLPAGSALASAYPISLMSPVSTVAIVCPPLSFAVVVVVRDSVECLVRGCQKGREACLPCSHTLATVYE
jgi:hypothetical protein